MSKCDDGLRWGTGRCGVPAGLPWRASIHRPQTGAFVSDSNSDPRGCLFCFYTRTSVGQELLPSHVFFGWPLLSVDFPPKGGKCVVLVSFGHLFPNVMGQACIAAQQSDLTPAWLRKSPGPRRLVTPKPDEHFPGAGGWCPVTGSPRAPVCH